MSRKFGAKSSSLYWSSSTDCRVISNDRFLSQFLSVREFLKEVTEDLPVSKKDTIECIDEEK